MSVKNLIVYSQLSSCIAVEKASEVDLASVDEKNLFHCL